MKWLDVAKGGAILLVVLHHAFLQLSGQGIQSAIYAPLDDLLKQVRMPTFFLASGIATSFLIGRSRTEFVARKLLPMAWIFLVWTVVLGLLSAVDPTAAPLSDDGVVTYVGEALVRPTNGMWFVWGLGLLTLAAFLVRRLPPALVLGGVAGLAVASGFGLVPHEAGPFLPWVVRNVTGYAFLFFAGLYLPAAFQRLAADPRRLAGATLAATATLIAVCALDLAQGGGLTAEWQPVRSLAGGLAGLGVAMGVAALPILGGWLEWVGARSLAIFVGHGVFLLPFERLAGRSLAAADPSEAARLATGLGLAVAAVLTALLLHAALTRLRLGWLYVLPPTVGRRAGDAIRPLIRPAAPA